MIVVRNNGSAGNITIAGSGDRIAGRHHDHRQPYRGPGGLATIYFDSPRLSP